MEKSPLAVPVAIVAAAALIAGAIYVGGKNKTQNAVTAEPVKKEITFKPITGADHIRGNPNAPIVLVEYSDYDCPFCSQFHATMLRAMDKYGTTGKVAWVYRHFPLTQTHPNAAKIAVASECVTEIAGNEAFWKFTDTIFNEKPVEVQDGQNVIGFTDISNLPDFAERAGADRGRFELCANSGKYDEAIAAAISEAIASGGAGTPHTLVVAGNQILTTLPGAIPFERYRGPSGETQPGLDEILADLTKQASSVAAPSGASAP